MFALLCILYKLLHIRIKGICWTKKMLRFLLVLCICFLGNIAAEELKRVCYWASWAVYRPGDGRHLVSDIDPEICTHIIYTFAKITKDARLVSYDPWCDFDDGLGNFKKFNDLKRKNPKLKTLLAVGGWNMGSEVFSNMSESQEGRKKFIQSSLSFVRKYNFDGFDLDWEYPADRGGKPEDKPNFTKLCKEFKEAFLAEGKRTNRQPLLLTAAVSAGIWTIPNAYEIPEISKYLDFINVMTYDLHGAWEPFVDHNSPLYPRVDQSVEQKKLTASFGVDYWIMNGAPAKKIIMGIPLYGRTFTLADVTKNKPGAAKKSAGPAGPFSREAGILTYFEICTYFKDEKGMWGRVWQDEYKAPYAIKGDFWVGYDDAESIKYKAEYVKNRRIGGAMVWSLEQDDFKNICGGGKDILLKTIKAVLTDDVLPEIPPPPGTPDPTATIKPTTKRPRPTRPISDGDEETNIEDGECQSNGFFRDIDDCSKFYQCVESGDTFIKYDYNCPADLKFDKTIKVCNYPNAVNCKN